MTFAAQRPQRLETLEFATGEHETVELLFNKAEVDVPSAEPSVIEFLFTGAGLGDRFGDVLERWFGLHGKAGPAIDLLLASKYRPSMHLENRFLNTVGAAEALHRRLLPGGVLPEEQHEARVAAVLEVVPTEHKRWVKWRLKHSNEPSLKERLDALIERTESVVRLWLGDTRQLAERVAEARNRITHHDPLAADSVPPPGELIELAESLYMVLTVFILHELGFSDAQIPNLVKYSRGWRTIEALRHT